MPDCGGDRVTVTSRFRPDRATLMAEYDRLYDEGNAILKQHDPCQIRTVDGVASCVRTRAQPSYENPNQEGQLCCGGCKHLGPNGCIVRSLGCKLSLCSYFSFDAPVVVALNDLQRQARALQVPSYFRASKEQCFSPVKEQL